MAGIAGDLFLKLYLVILVSGKLALVSEARAPTKKPQLAQCIACVQTPLPSGKIGEGPLSLFMRGEGRVCTQATQCINGRNLLQ